MQVWNQRPLVPEKHLFMVMREPEMLRVGLHVAADPDDKQTPYILPLPGEKISLIPATAQPSETTGVKPEKSSGNQGESARRIWLISPLTEIPPDTRVELKVEPGLVSFFGTEPGVENRVLTVFHSFPEFAFQGIECVDNRNKKINLGPAGGPGFESRCNPLRGAALIFTSPVIDEEVKDHVMITPDLAGGRSDYDPWANRRGYSRLNAPHKQGRKYLVRLPEVLKANQVYSIQSDPAEFKDEFGRSLAVPIDIEFATDHRPPDFTLTHPRAVLEKDADTEVPLVVTNLERATVTYDRLTAGGKQTGRFPGLFRCQHGQ